MKKYLISFDLNDDIQDIKLYKLRNYLETMPQWSFFLPNLCIFNSEKTVLVLKSEIEKLLKNTDYFVICEITNNFDGNLNATKGINWLKENLF